MWGIDRNPPGPSELNRYVMAFDIASFAKPPIECGHERIRVQRLRWCAAAGGEDADHRHRLLLGAEWAARGHGAAEQEHQIAAFHSITYSSGRVVRLIG